MIVQTFLTPIAPILSLVVGSVLIILLECLPKAKGMREVKFWVAFAGAFGGVLVSFWLWKIPLQTMPLGSDEPVWLLEFRNAFRFDAITVLYGLVIALFTCLSIVFASLNFRDSEYEGEVYALMLLVAVGMMLLVSSDSLLMVFLSLELLSLPTYVLVGVCRHDKRALEGSLKYFLLGSFATVFLLFGISFLYAQFGTLHISRIAEVLSAGLPLEGKSTALTLGGLALLLISACFKIGAVPFHMWVPDVYEGAPTTLTGFMGSAIKLAGFGLILRIVWGMFLPLFPHWSGLVDGIAILTMFVGNIAALSQDNLKRLFAYSSIAHAGYLLVAIGSVSGGTVVGEPLFYYLLVYGLMFLGVFAIIAFIEHSTHSSDIYQISGMGFSHPLLALCLAVLVLSAAGIPPTAGFMAKYFVFLEAVRAGKTPLVVCAVINSLIAAYYYLRVIVYLYMKESKERIALPAASRFAFVCIVLCALSTLYFAVAPITSPMARF